MKRDKTFKENFTIKGTTLLDENIIKNYRYYKPDLIFEDSNEIVVLEHSSTGDRKTHIGELTQFFDFANTYKTNKWFSFIIFLDGVSENSPKVDDEVKRLKYYVEHTFNNQLDNIAFIGVCKYDKTLIGIDLYDLKVKCACVYEVDLCEEISYRNSVQIVCSNLKSNISDDNNFITDVVELIENNLKENISFEINPENDKNQYSDYPICAIGECSICNRNNKHEHYSIFIERQTLDDTLILNVEINIENDHVYSGISDNIYVLKTEMKDVLKKGFKNIYWQFDEHNNSICKELYSRIYVLENEFRQLIIEFLMKNYGYKWEEKLVNRVLKNKIADYSNWYKQNFSEFREVYIDLFNLQVSDLITFLKSVYEVEKVQEETKEYLEGSTIPNQISNKGLDKVIDTIKMKLSDVLSNNSVWNTYIINVLGSDFEGIWNEFSMMRNMVAHNKPICKQLYAKFERTEQILLGRFNDLKSYIANRFDSKYKENIDILNNKRSIEVQEYEDMYREEAGLDSMPNDEEDVFDEINENDYIVDLNNCIQEYIDKFKSLSDELLCYLDDIDFENVDLDLKEKICREVFKVNSNIADDEYNEKVYKLKCELENGITNISYDSRVEFGTIAELYCLGECVLTISVGGYLCICEGSTDTLTVVLKENDSEVERGIIEKTYGEYYISDCGDARPEVEDDLQVDISDLQSVLEGYLENTIESLKMYINVFEE